MNRLALASVVVISLVSFGFTQKPKPKPKPKPPPKTAPTLGTVQLPGDNGKLGTTYQIGDKGFELHFTLDSAEFAMRYPTERDAYVAKESDKLLILTFTVHNPQKSDVNFDYGSFKFTSVSPRNENRECNSYTYHPETHKIYSLGLKPAQKVKAFVVFPVHGDGPITKLMVQRGSGAVLRYDLRDKVKKVTSIFAADGVNVDTKGATTLGATFDAGAFDVTIDKVEETQSAVGQYEPAEGQSLYLVYATFKNTLMAPQRVVWGMFDPKLSDSNGELMEWTSDMLTISGNKTIDQDIDGGETIKGKYVFRGPKNVTPKKLVLNSSDLQRVITVAFP